jgi:hypothetical protein
VDVQKKTVVTGVVTVVLVVAVLVGVWLVRSGGGGAPAGPGSPVPVAPDVGEEGASGAPEDSDGVAPDVGEEGESGAPEGSDGVAPDVGEEGATNGLVEAPRGRGIISAVTLEEATGEAGGPVAARGVLAMPEGERGDVAISVSWVDPETSSVYARGVATLGDVAPGERRRWEVVAELPPGAEGAVTVLGAVIVE